MERFNRVISGGGAWTQASVPVLALGFSPWRSRSSHGCASGSTISSRGPDGGAIDTPQQRAADCAVARVGTRVWSAYTPSPLTQSTALEVDGSSARVASVAPASVDPFRSSALG